jgi:hypothetical protein
MREAKPGDCVIAEDWLHGPEEPAERDGILVRTHTLGEDTIGYILFGNVILSSGYWRLDPDKDEEGAGIQALLDFGCVRQADGSFSEPVTRSPAPALAL